MVMRGEVYWVDFGDPVGSEPADVRPGLVVQNDVANRTASTTIVVGISSGLPKKRYPMHVHLPSGTLPKASVVKCEQVATVAVDQRLIDVHQGPMATLGAETMSDVDAALRRILDLY
jgi:mRNA interferase MazF